MKGIDIAMDKNYEYFRGVFALLLTPYKDDRSIDYDALAAYTEWQAASGSQHLFAVCGSSEMGNQTLDERVKCAETAVKSSNGVGIVVTANLEPSWYAQVEEVKRMSATGAEALVFVTKGYGDDPERMYTYLCELAQHTALPIFLYEYPGCKPHLMPADIYGRLVKTGRFFGIKDTTCSLSLIKEKIAVQGDSAVLQANIPYLYDAYVAGARGVMATTTTCGAHLFARMWSEFCAGELDKCAETHREICVLDNALEGGFSATAKYLVNKQGCPMNWITRGDHNLSAQKQKALDVFYDYAKARGILL